MRGHCFRAGGVSTAGRGVHEESVCGISIIQPLVVCECKQSSRV